MTYSLCDHVAERLALGGPLGELAEHVATCPNCNPLVAASETLSAIHRDVDPGLGFSARMTIGAQHRIAARRRRRLAAGLATTVATGAFGVFLVTRSPDVPHTPTRDQAGPTTSTPAKSLETDPDPNDQSPTTADDADLAALVQFADVDRSSRLSAKWAHIKKPLAPYKKLVKGVTP
ncbi:MAG TPA: hypothetical protein VHN14_19850 [Kofleriaceae bacterium]|jgi:hypothetical protein|nr:hypothetical protein [Kofleriaceae bacterium]